MSILGFLRDVGGCAGGILIYEGAEATLAVRHPLRTRRRLRTETVARLQHLYPRLDLRRVTFVTSASLPANWFEDFAVAMTFGYTIWFKWTRHHVEETDEGLAVLMHELVHVDQVRRRAGSRETFACDYGAGYLAAGSYPDNPLEREAFDFVDNHPVPPPAVNTSLLLYDPHKRDVEIVKTLSPGKLGQVATKERWRSTWSTIVSGAFLGSSWDDILLYDRSAGEGELVQFGDDGRLRRVKSFDAWRRTWDIIVPGSFGGDGWTDLFFYDRQAGEAELYVADGSGSLRRLRRLERMRRTWDLVVPGEFGSDGGTDLFFYDRAAGEAEFYALDGSGDLHLLTRLDGLRRSWDVVVPGRFSSDEWTDLLFYDRAAGEIEVYAPEGLPVLNRLFKGSGLRKSWDLICPGKFGGDTGRTDLLFYDRTNGDAEVLAVDGDGTLGSLGLESHWRTSWAAIVAGVFTA